MSASPLEDETLYNKGSVRITRTLLEIGGTQYQIRNIDTVKKTSKEPDRTRPRKWIRIGIVMLIISLIFYWIGLFVLGIIILLFAINWLNSLKATHAITIVTTGGKEVNHSSQNIDEIKAIQSALETAMARLA